ncbi:MAG: hypothetical protein EOO11_03100 [Chitinophagaceae bacterium]|nr:MAG: hypothetical protein EOO11_03100 [Chitinophagaceae bacterium]
MNRSGGIGLLVLLFFLSGCLGAGTHGSIQDWEFPVTKIRLAQVVDSIIDTNPAIRRDTVRNHWIDQTGGRQDTVENNYYNDRTTYQTIYIRSGSGDYCYVFRFGGGKVYWDTARAATLFIAYAYDGQGKGGSEGNGAFPWYKKRLRKQLVATFEAELIANVSRALGKG